jgi:carboxypeptidase Taq
MNNSPYQQLEQEWRRMHAFRGALALLRWDAAVMMPRGSAEVRAEQLAALESELHALLTAPKITRLLERARAGGESLEDWQQANLREMQRQRDHAIAVPVSLISRLTKAAALAESQWLAARRDNDFSIFAPHLQGLLQLVRDKAALLGQALSLSPYDALMDEYGAGFGTADMDALFRSLGRRLPKMIGAALQAQGDTPLPALSGRFPASRQRALVVEVMKSIGFPFDRGRLDESEHPFTEGVAGDIRVTTRFDAADPFNALLGALHETGHAMYDLGMPQAWRDQPVGRDRGMALEESQSLLLEMIVGRSRPFVSWLQPLLVKHFGVQGPEWAVDAVLQRLTRVRRGLIRVDADELSYPLHVLHRYELEKKLIDGQLAVRDLQEAWDSGMQQHFGLCPANLTEGCLQDVHWALGLFGYFPSYALGGVIAAQLWESLCTQVPDVDAQIARGEFAGVMSWLRDRVHSQGARLPVKDLVLTATGQPLGATALLRHLERKYGAVSS